MRVPKYKALSVPPNVRLPAGLASGSALSHSENVGASSSPCNTSKHQTEPKHLSINLADACKIACTELLLSSCVGCASGTSEHKLVQAKGNWVIGTPPALQASCKRWPSQALSAQACPDPARHCSTSSTPTPSILYEVEAIPFQ